MNNKSSDDRGFQKEKGFGRFFTQFREFILSASRIQTGMGLVGDKMGCRLAFIVSFVSLLRSKAHF